MTRKLYWEDAYQKEFDAKVVSVNGNEIVLDQTCFYPTSGGQLNDIGEINGTRIAGVRYNENGDITHILEEETDFKPGDMVHGKIDWGRRYKIMRIHSAAHVISAVLIKNVGNVMFTGSQIYEDRARMDFNLEKLDDEIVKLIEDKSNEAVQMRLPIISRIITAEEAKNDPSLKRVDPSLYEKYKELRVVEIKDFDVQLDGGTHVANTVEIGKIKVVKRENKGKNNRRITIQVD